MAEKAGRILAALLALVLLLTGCAGKAPEATQPRSDFTPYAVPEFAGSGFHPELAEDLRQCSDFYLESVDALRHLLFD